MNETSTVQERKRRPPSLLLRATPSLTDVAFLMPLVFIYLKLDGTKTLLGDGDTGWHIRTGEWILANGRVPTQDMFSYTKAGEPWFAWEWLSDVVFGWLHAAGGLEAVVLFTQLVLCLTGALLYRAVRRQCPNVVIAIGVTLLALAATSIHWLSRPHVFTLLFVVTLYSILERVREGRIRLLWATIPLTALWTNLHGGFFVGLILIGCYGVGEGLQALWQSGPQSGWERLKPYGLAGVGSLAASFFNPYGYHLHEHIYEYLLDPYHRTHIQEFGSLNFQTQAALYFEALLLLGAVAAFAHLLRGRFSYVLMIGGWAHLALYSARNIPIYALAAAPSAGWALQAALGRAKGSQTASWIKSFVREFEDFAADMARTDRPARFHFISAGVFICLGLLLYSPNAAGKLRAEFDPNRYPEAAMAALDSLGEPVRIFANDEWGDYLIYRSYPSLRVFVDGRSDFYGSEFSLRYLDTARVRYDWETNLDRHGVDTVLESAGSALSGAMKESSGWRLIYDDGLAVVFRRSTGCDVDVPAGAGERWNRVSDDAARVQTRQTGGARPKLR